MEIEINGKHENFKGMLFGHLTVLKWIKGNGDKKGGWLCECDCKDKTNVIVDTRRLKKGLKTHCGCLRKYVRIKAKEFPSEYIGKTKPCCMCKEELEYKEFYFKEVIDIENKKEYIFSPRCIKCNKKHAIIWNNENIEKKRESCRKNSRKPNIRKYHKELCERQRESGWTREYYHKNKGKHRAYTIKYESHKHHTISEKDWIICKEFFEYRCGYCGMTEVEHKDKHHQQLHKEHAYNEGDNGISNCVPSCVSCNSAKKKVDWIDWYIPDNPKYEQQRYNKIVEWLENYQYIIEHK